jgi:hypothetical protein
MVLAEINVSIDFFNMKTSPIEVVLKSLPKAVFQHNFFYMPKFERTLFLLNSTIKNYTTGIDADQYQDLQVILFAPAALALFDNSTFDYFTLTFLGHDNSTTTEQIIKNAALQDSGDRYIGRMLQD